MRLLQGLLAVLLLASPGRAEDPPVVGSFALTNLQVPAASVVAGGPKRDAIRSVDQPSFASVQDASWAGALTEVLGVVRERDARAYPLRMLEYHQIVNDVIGGDPIAVTYDPLAGTPFAYDRRVDGKTLTFGVSGLLYNHNFLLFDRETESLWSQFLGRAIAGPLAGKTLVRVAVRQETARTWLLRHPDSQVLRHPNPERIEYRLSPYQAYWMQNRINFPVEAKDPRYHAKELVLGVVVGDQARAYLGSIVTREGGRVEDELGGVKVQLSYESDTGTFTWEIPEPAEVAEAYWLAWKAFHPKTEIWHDEKEPVAP